MSRMSAIPPIGPPGTHSLRHPGRRAKTFRAWLSECRRGWRAGRGYTVPGLNGPGRASDHAPIVAEFGE